ncbi:MAG TPA: DEAD/DEAH box helicase family protein [Miltoncostaeaceae bacterium]|nr:DEAD/DEAH box helicase family protein [Miltoncostaeaceae bacterium]
MPDGSHPTTEPTAPAPPGEALSRALADPASAWPDVVLREHQLEALDELASRLSHGATRTWVDAPTGSGKTIMFLALAAALGGSTLVLVPRRNLAEQTAAGLARHFPAVESHPEGPDSAGKPGVAVCTYQAALRHQERMDWEPVTLLICDEAHTTLGAQTRRMLDRAGNAVIVGFTATGATTTGHVEQVFGPVATTLDRLSAIERGILCPLRSLRVERAVDLSDVARVRGDFDQASLGRALDRAKWHRACADVWEEHFAPMGLAGVAYTATVAQAHALAEELAARGVRAAAVSGQTPGRELQRVLFDFASERIDVLCNADLLTEGWDETRASVVMHLAPTTSERVFVQRLGRVMRPAPDKEAVSVEFLPVGDPMGVQTSHDVFGLGWYRPLGRVAGPPETGERGKLAQAAQLLADQNGGSAKLVNPAAAPGLIAAGLVDGGWRDADPALLPVTLMEEWVEAAAHDVTVDELIELVTAGVDPLAAVPWWALSGLVARRLHDGADQPLWRAWATALLVQPDLRRALPDDVPRRVLDRLRMTSRERLRALWWHADQSGRWERLATLEQLGRSGDRRRRWSALDEASTWAPSWAWDVSRALADNARPGRNQEVARIAAWEAHHLISNGGDLALIGIWLRAAGEPPPEPVPPDDEGALRLGQAARLLVMLGPGDVPARSEHLRLAGRAAAAAGGWAKLRGHLDALDLSSPDARRALRAAVGAMQPKALLSRRAYNALRARFPRLPEPELVGVGEPRKRAAGEEGATPAPRRRRRRRRLRAAPGAEGAPQGGEAQPQRREERRDGEPATPEAAPVTRRRRRRRRRPRGAPAGADAAAGPDVPPPEPAGA